jgi:DNA-binding PadR family transcriptional regulator
MREQLIMLEIGSDRIDTASSFVDYVNEEYGFSKSSVWYNLNQLKEHGLAEFANKEEIGKPLCLTRIGKSQLGSLEPSRRDLLAHFSGVLMQRVGPYGGLGNGYAEGVYR